MNTNTQMFTQLKRILELDKLLQRQQHRPTLKEISGSLEVDERTVHRYFNLLKENFKAPVTVEKNGSRYEYFYSDSNYSFTDLVISQNEANALVTAKYLLQSVPLTEFYSQTLEGLEKLLSRAKHFNRTKGLSIQDKIIFAHDCDKAPCRKDLVGVEKVLCEAFEKNLPVRFTFSDGDVYHDLREEVYYPLLLTSFHQNWYVLAVKNALGKNAKLDYKLPKKLSEKDFELIDFYSVEKAKIVALSKEHELPELIARHENSFAYTQCARILYDDTGIPILSFLFWFMGYEIALEYKFNMETALPELYRRTSLPMVYKQGE